MLRFLCRFTAAIWAAWLAWKFVGKLTEDDPTCRKYREAVPTCIRIGRGLMVRE